MTITVRLGAETPAVMVYGSEGDEFITITARALEDTSNGLDTVIEILNPDGFRLAYSDTHTLSDTLSLDDTLAPTDAAIEHLYLRDAGLYEIRVDTFSGLVAGEVEVNLQIVEDVPRIVEPESDEVTRLTIELADNQVFRYALPTSGEGLTYTVTARSLSGGGDALLALTDSNGELLADNDDHQTGRLDLNIFDALIEDFAWREDTPPVLELREFLGRAGQFEILIELRSN